MRLPGLLIAALLWLGAPAAPAQEPLAVPALQARVTDLAGALPAPARQALETRLAAIEQARGAQVAILILPSTAPEAIEAYSMRVAEAWKLGRKGADNGLLITVATADRRMRIEVGYGLEGAIPDARAKQIVADMMAPRFKLGDFEGGLTAAVEAIDRLLAGEPAPQPAKRTDAGGWLPGFDTLLFLVFFAFGITNAVLGAVLGRFFGATANGLLWGAVAWLLLGTLVWALGIGAAVFVFSLLGLSGASFIGGGRGGGFAGGGGFGGGGGGFGGGGASGRW